jgi:hypothetical protein
MATVDVFHGGKLGKRRWLRGGQYHPTLQMRKPRTMNRGDSLCPAVMTLERPACPSPLSGAHKAHQHHRDLTVLQEKGLLDSVHPELPRSLMTPETLFAPLKTHKTLYGTDRIGPQKPRGKVMDVDAFHLPPCSPFETGCQYVAQSGLELTIFLPHPPKC